MQIGLAISGSKWSFISIVTLPKIESANPFFLNFYSASLTKAYINWKRISPLSGTKPFPFQSAPESELVVINVKSIILSGVSLDIILA